MAAGAITGTMVGLAFAHRSQDASRKPPLGSQANPVVKTFGLDPQVHEKHAFERRQAQINTYQGTKVLPDPHSRGLIRKLQEEVAETLARLDFEPNARTDHFRWISDSDPAIRFMGWKGTVQEIAPEGGRFVVRVKIHPCLVSEGATAISTPDYLVEVYSYANGHMNFLGIEEPIDAQRAIFED